MQKTDIKRLFTSEKHSGQLPILPGVNVKIPFQNLQASFSMLNCIIQEKEKGVSFSLYKEHGSIADVCNVASEQITRGLEQYPVDIQNQSGDVERIPFQSGTLMHSAESVEKQTQHKVANTSNHLLSTEVES